MNTPKSTPAKAALGVNQHYADPVPTSTRILAQRTFGAVKAINPSALGGCRA